jgi:hypothetical protein
VVIASALPLLALDRQRSSSEVAASFTPLKTLAK